MTVIECEGSCLFLDYADGQRRRVSVTFSAGISSPVSIYSGQQSTDFADLRA